MRDFYTYIEVIKQCLSDEETRKSQEIRNEETRRLFCLRKGITRIIHSSFLDINPYEIKYEYTDYGKPLISYSVNKAFHFNISHSKEYLFVGIAKNGDIGVDIEKINPKLNHFLLASSVFSPDELAIYSKYNKLNRIRSFYKAWVQKEAICKAIGVGLSLGFNNFSVNIDPSANDVEYSLSIDNLKYLIKIRVKFEKDYVFASALLTV
ncbi:4'-phosphopantetheinyl transferase family protein [Petroclostridium xylanilyticum]|uniref:4'-phosphopantetheinyl transferase family protein n=1 Tax=Petroclostridium xylanilyticum TaxID=1792311 RepID=UPI0012FF814D|nr:4'-phosphopantetheinyl transferase superfamily protein [Petroclostridium xylanilyticum]